MPGDYDNNGPANVAVYRPSSGVWFVLGGVPDVASSPNQTVSWGAPGDRPAPADYDGDGATDIAVYRPSTGQWFVRNGALAQWGISGDQPVPAYYGS